MSIAFAKSGVVARDILAVTTGRTIALWSYGRGYSAKDAHGNGCRCEACSAEHDWVLRMAKMEDEGMVIPNGASGGHPRSKL